MALVTCSECGKEISSAAAACVGCGAPLARHAIGGRADYAAGVEMAELLDKKRPTNHVLHFIFSLLTGGLWAIVWLILVLSRYQWNSKIDQQIEKMKSLRG